MKLSTLLIVTVLSSVGVYSQAKDVERGGSGVSFDGGRTIGSDSRSPDFGGRESSKEPNVSVQPKSATLSVAKKTATQGVRTVSAPAVGRLTGQVIGKTLGKTVEVVVKGGWLGFGWGIIITPEEIGCGEGESCSK